MHYESEFHKCVLMQWACLGRAHPDRHFIVRHNGSSDSKKWIMSHCSHSANAKWKNAQIDFSNNFPASALWIRWWWTEMTIYLFAIMRITNICKFRGIAICSLFIDGLIVLFRFAVNLFLYLFETQKERNIANVRFGSNAIPYFYQRKRNS